MIDPYGDDLEDLMVITIVTTCIEITRICLNSNDQGAVDEALEETLRQKHNQLSFQRRNMATINTKNIAAKEQVDHSPLSSTEHMTERSLEMKV